MTAPRLTVYVADDHPVFREGLERIVRANRQFELVGAAGDGRVALEEIAALDPDVALLDLHMPDLDGLAILNALRRDERRTRVVIISGDLSAEIVFEAVARGAAGYLPKEASPERIADALAAVGRGGTVLPPEIQAGLAAAIQRRGGVERPALSAREHEILLLAADGQSAPDIAVTLVISPATVRTHLQHLYEKLGVSDRAAAVAEAMRRGLIE
jgi:two-component system nitrate/nitrite response regulator NarL